MATILQAPILTNYLYPFLLIFIIVFAILEKFNVLGENKKQLNALLSLVIGLVFVSAVFPVLMVENLILFLTVGLAVIFVGMMLWGFVSNGEIAPGPKMKKFYIVLGIIIMVIVIIWAAGAGSVVFTGLQKFFNWLFNSSWSGTFWTNAIIIVLIGIAIAAAVGFKPSSSSGSG